MREVAFIFDTDALIQILIPNKYQLFEILLNDFNVRSYMMSEVDVELRSHHRFGRLLTPRLERSLKSKALSLLSQSELDKLAGEELAVSFEDIRKLGAEYALNVDLGEAHTHAAGVLMNTPIVSNDRRAIKVLQEKGKTLPPTVLRSFDMFGFMHFEGYLDTKSSAWILKELKQQQEGVPHCFRNASFEDGIQNFDTRLSTSLAVTAASTSSLTYSSTLYLQRKAVPENNGEQPSTPVVSEQRMVESDAIGSERPKS